MHPAPSQSRPCPWFYCGESKCQTASNSPRLHCGNSGCMWLFFIHAWAASRCRSLPPRRKSRPLNQSVRESPNHVPIKRTSADHFLQRSKFCTVQGSPKDTRLFLSIVWKKQSPFHPPTKGIQGNLTGFAPHLYVPIFDLLLKHMRNIFPTTDRKYLNILTYGDIFKKNSNATVLERMKIQILNWF